MREDLECYRYGFNGKENDIEVKGEGNQQDYGFRIYDPRIAKFLSVDPLSPQYPWYTPYQFAGNKSIGATDLDGLEEKSSLLKQFVDAIGFPKLMEKHFDNVEEEAEFQQVQALKQNGLKKVSSDLKNLHDAQGVALGFAPGGSTLFSMLDYGAGIEKDPRNIVKAGATHLAFALGGSLFGKVGNLKGTLQDKFISNFNRISKRFGSTWGDFASKWEIHHIIPRGLADNPLIKKLTNAKLFDIEGLDNGIILPKYSTTRGLGDGMHASHPEYNKSVERVLNEINGDVKNSIISIGEAGTRVR